MEKNKKIKPKKEKDILREQNVLYFEEHILSKIDHRFTIGLFQGPMYKIYLSELLTFDYYPKGQRACIKEKGELYGRWIDLPNDLVIKKIKELLDE